MTNSYLRECHLAAWRIKTGLTEEDYRELLRDLQTAWRDVESRIENFESLYGLAFRCNLQGAIRGEENISPQTSTRYRR